jgi:hypothetical protein
VTLSGGEASDYNGYGPVMDEPGPEPKVLIADKGYDSDAIREDLVKRGAESVIRRARTARSSRPSMATSTRSETSSNAASQSSSTAAGWQRDTTRPPPAMLVSCSSHPQGCGSGILSTEPSHCGSNATTLRIHSCLHA